MRDHMTRGCNPAECPYCDKHRRSEVRVALLEEVAHRAWHLLDGGGEVADQPDAFEGMKRDADRLSDALDALEADRWTAHPDDEPSGKPASVQRPPRSPHRPDPGHEGC